MPEYNQCCIGYANIRVHTLGMNLSLYYKEIYEKNI